MESTWFYMFYWFYCYWKNSLSLMLLLANSLFYSLKRLLLNCLTVRLFGRFLETLAPGFCCFVSIGSAILGLPNEDFTGFLFAASFTIM